MTASTTPAAVVQAAGGLVWRVRMGRLQVVLVHRPRYKDWSWPKGKLEQGESHVIAAVREIEEETGLEVVLGRPLPRLEYALADGRHKRVHYWAAQVAGRPDRPAMRARPPVRPAERSEIDLVRWFDADVAARRLTRDDDRIPLAALVEAHEKRELDTRALVIARHGRARSRASWSGDEGTRPLTPAGSDQAAALPPVLSAFGVADVVTSPWERCRASVAPYCSAAGLTPRTVDALTEHAHAHDPMATAAVLTELLRVASDTVVCTHRPVLPTLLKVVGAHAENGAAAALPDTDPYLRPGEMLVSHVVTGGSGPRVVAVERHRPAV